MNALLKSSAIFLGIWLSISGALAQTNTDVDSSTNFSTNQEIVIDKSLSPDGSKYLTIKDVNPTVQFPDGASGTAKVKDTKTGETLGSFDWVSGMGYHPDKNAFAVLWRSDSKAFAISWELTRGFSTNAVYFSQKDNWVQVELPDCFGEIKKLCNEDEGVQIEIHPGMGGKGHEIVKKWLPDNRLILESTARQFSSIQHGDYQLFWATYRIKNSKGKSPPKAYLESVKLAPDSAYSP